MSAFKSNALRGIVAAVLAVGLAGCGLTPVSAPSPSTTETTTTETETNAKQDQTTATSESYVSTDATEVGLAPTSGYMPSDTVDFNTEEYASVEEQGYVSTRANPLSTVSADVDTASYGNLRRMLYDGYKVSPKQESKDSGTDTGTGTDVVVVEDEYYDPYSSDKYIPTGAVRIEEMVNYFDYNYDKPSGDDKFGITVHMSTCPWNADTDLLELGFATADEDQSARENGSNLVFLIDVSGSMKSAEKLPLLQSSFGKLVEKLGEKDTISIVTYSGKEEVVLDGASGSNQRDIMQAIRSLEAGGATNGEAGLTTAYDLAQKHFKKDGVNRIVMASDGDLNVGMTSESDLHDFVEEKRKSGVYLSVLGFGTGNYKDTKMETLADHGNGSYHYIDSEQEAERVFGDKITANLVPFANDVKVQVEFNPAQIKGYRLIGYENRKLNAEDFKDDTKDAGEVGPSSQFTVLYEVVPNDSKLDVPVPELKYEQEQASSSNADEWLTAKIRYKPVDGTDVKEQERSVSKSDWTSDPGEDWRFASAVTEFGMLLRNSEFKGTSDYSSIRSLVGETTDPLRTEFLSLVDMAEKN